MSPPRDNRGLYLSECQDLGQIVWMRCNYCRGPARFYDPADLRELLGDVEVDSLRRRRMKCERCGRRDYLDVGKRWRNELERTGLVIRRLERITIIRRPIWREDKL